MRDEFYRIYRELDEEYIQQQLRAADVGGMAPKPMKPSLPFGVRRLSQRESLLIVNDALSEALRNSALHVRPDAVYFLRLNLHQMISLPLFRAASGDLHHDGPRLHLAELREALVHDANVVLQEAAQTGGREITGHAIIDALARSWSFLVSASSEIWG